MHSGSAEGSASYLAWVTLAIGVGLGILFALFLLPSSRRSRERVVRIRLPNLNQISLNLRCEHL